MPEMPEVEAIRRTLHDKIVGRRIVRVDVLLPRLIKWPSAEQFQAAVTDATIAGLVRRGSTCCCIWTTPSSWSSTSG